MKYKVNSEITYFTLDRDDDVIVKIAGIVDGEVVLFEPPRNHYFFVNNPQEALNYLQKVRNLGVVDLIDEGYRSGDEIKEPVLTVELNSPNIDSNVAEFFKLKGFRTFETSIRYTRRLFIDKLFKVHYNDFVFFDIETDSSYGFPKDYGKYPFLSISVWARDGSWSEWYYIKDYDSEEEMLSEFIKLLMKKKISFVVGWNVDFDYNHVLYRLKELKLYDEYRYWRLVSKLDLLERYKAANPGLGSYSLHNVSIEENFKVKEMTKLPHEMTRQELFEYNMYDSEILQLINDKYQLVETAIEIAHFVNLPMSNAMSTVARLEAEMFRRLRELGYVGVRRNQGVSRKDYRGAIVLDSHPGVHDYVIVVDFESLYPNTIINKNIDIKGFNGEVFPYIVRKTLDERLNHKRKWKEYTKKAEEYKRLYKETGDERYKELYGEYERKAFIEKIKSDAKKIVVNGYYGANANEYYYFFDPDVAAAITAGGREMLMKARSYAEDVLGLPVIYGDTDSLFIKIEGLFKKKDGIDKDVFELTAKEIAAVINNHVSPWRVDVDKLIKRIIFLRDSKGRGVKKRYAYIDFDGNIKIKGLEVVKGDWCKLAKYLQKKVIEMILRDNASRSDVMRFVKQVKKEMYDGKYDEWLILTKNMAKDVSEYDSRRKYPDHVVAWIKAESRGTPFELRQVSYVYTKSLTSDRPEPEPVVRLSDLKKYKLDYDYYWEHLVAPPAMRVIDSVFPVNQSILKWIK